MTRAAKTVTDSDERSEKMYQLHDAFARAHAIISGASAIGGMASVSGRGVDFLRRLVLEVEGVIREARELAEELQRA
jgi:hypothetical protein